MTNKNSPVSDIVDVNVNVLSNVGFKQDISTCLVLTKDETLPATDNFIEVSTKSYNNQLKQFSPDSEPYKILNTHFQNGSKNIIILRQILQDTPAEVVGGDIKPLSEFQTITTGDFQETVNNVTKDVLDIDFTNYYLPTSGRSVVHITRANANNLFKVNNGSYNIQVSGTVNTISNLDITALTDPATSLNSFATALASLLNTATTGVTVTASNIQSDTFDIVFVNDETGKDKNVVLLPSTNISQTDITKVQYLNIDTATLIDGENAKPVQSYSDVATVVQDKYNAVFGFNQVVFKYDSINNRFVRSTVLTGASASLSNWSKASTGTGVYIGDMLGFTKVLEPNQLKGQEAKDVIATIGDFIEKRGEKAFYQVVLDNKFSYNDTTKVLDFCNNRTILSGLPNYLMAFEESYSTLSGNNSVLKYAKDKSYDCLGIITETRDYKTVATLSILSNINYNALNSAKTLHANQLVGCVSDFYNETQKAQITEYKGSWYSLTGNTGFFRDGYSNGEFKYAHTVQQITALFTQCQTDLFNLITNARGTLKNTPDTNMAGKSVLETTCNQYVNNGVLSPRNLTELEKAQVKDFVTSSTDLNNLQSDGYIILDNNSSDLDTMTFPMVVIGSNFIKRFKIEATVKQ